jgi:MoxR-like ATPase
MEVMLPDMDARDVAVPDDKVSTCMSCANYVREEAVGEELGWTAGLCAAKGKLIISTQAVREATGCEFRVFGTPRDETLGMFVLPEYNVGDIPTSTPIDAWKIAYESNPREYETDAPVTEKDAAGGIRAWRRIVDPENPTRHVDLPIYGESYFSPEEYLKVPQAGDDEHPELYVDHNAAVYKVAVLWVALDETPALWGEAGVGKTELFRHIAWLMQLPFERISITASSELDDLAGKFHFSQETGTYFEYGRVPQAWQKPSVICLDEPNVGPPDVWQFFRPLTDNSKQLVLDQNKGERLSRHPDAYLGMAMNPSWDSRNVGADQIGDADGSRLSHIFMNLPPEPIERDIILRRCEIDGFTPERKQLDMVMRISAELRTLSKQQTLPITWGIRPQIKVTRALRWFEPLQAYRLAAADYLEPEAQEVMLNVVRSHMER